MNEIGRVGRIVDDLGGFEKTIPRTFDTVSGKVSKDAKKVWRVEKKLDDDTGEEGTSGDEKETKFGSGMLHKQRD